MSDNSTIQPVSGGEGVKLTKAQRRAWERRARTIHDKAAALLSDMIAALGVDHDATDYADAVVNEAADLTQLLGNDRLHLWSRPAGRAALQSQEPTDV